MLHSPDNAKHAQGMRPVELYFWVFLVSSLESFCKLSVELHVHVDRTYMYKLFQVLVDTSTYFPVNIFFVAHLYISCVTVYSTAIMCCLHNDNTHTWVCPLTAVHHEGELPSHWVKSELAQWDRRERLGPGERRCGEKRRSHWVCLDEYWSSTFEWEEEADHTQVQLSGAHGLDMRVQEIHTMYM